MTQRNPTQFVKMCPKCNKEQYYKNIGSLLHALRKNAQCKKCLYSDKSYLEKLSKSNVGQLDEMEEIINAGSAIGINF